MGAALQFDIKGGVENPCNGSLFQNIMLLMEISQSIKGAIPKSKEMVIMDESMEN